MIIEHKSAHRCGTETYGSFRSKELSSRIARYAKAHQRALDMAGWLHQERDHGGEADAFPEIAKRLSGCGSWLKFRVFDGVLGSRLTAADFCHLDKLCPLCAIRRGGKLLKRLSERLATVLREQPGLVPYMVTFTVKNGPDLAERFEHIQRGVGVLTERWRKLRNMRRGSPTELAKAAGLHGSFEIKRGQNSKLWHPHFHAVLLADQAIDQEKLQAEWKEITEDSHMIHVQPLRCASMLGLLKGEALIQAIAADVVEVCKYALKFSDMDFADNWEASRVLARRRLVRAFGCLFRVQIPADLLDDVVDVSDLPFIELLYRYEGAAYVLKKEFFSVDNHIPT